LEILDVGHGVLDLKHMVSTMEFPTLQQAETICDTFNAGGGQPWTYWWTTTDGKVVAYQP
jgi:hypothetical protein